jgi:hypothetical protein
MSQPRQRTKEALGGALGFSQHHQWWATETEVDMATAPPAPIAVRIACEPQAVMVDMDASRPPA